MLVSTLGNIKYIYKDGFRPAHFCLLSHILIFSAIRFDLLSDVPHNPSQCESEMTRSSQLCMHIVMISRAVHTPGSGKRVSWSLAPHDLAAIGTLSDRD